MVSFSKARCLIPRFDGAILSFEWKDDGCYEVDVTDLGGNTIKAVIDPATLDVIRAKLEDFAPAN